MNLIVAVDQNWGIGMGQNLLYNLPKDMEFFKNTTKGNVVVMGENTLFSLPGGKPLKNRTNIVLSNNPNLTVEGASVVHSLNQLFELLKQFNSNQVFVIGGAYVYEQLLPYCHTAYVTQIFAKREANKFFPNLEKLSSWKQVATSETMEENNIRFAFTTWQNNQPKQW